MKIGLFALAGVRVGTPALAELGVTLPGFVRRGEVIASMPSLGLLTVAGLTPPGHELEYHDIPDPISIAASSRGPALEDLRSGQPLPDVELAAISSLSARIREAYLLADALRARGTKVVMGGLHVSAEPEEALQHADAVVTGGAEGTWPRVVEDMMAGRLARIYPGATDGVFQEGRYARPRFDLLRGGRFNRATVQTSRGCPRGCEFCGASLRITRRYNQKPVELVMEEIRDVRKQTGLRFFEFADDNTFLDRRWSRDFLRQLEREQIHWFTETDISVVDEPSIWKALRPSGCRQLLIGLESPEPDDLTSIDPASWKRHRAPAYRHAIDLLQGSGVSINGCFVLGLDNHTPDIFERVLEFVRESGLAEAQFTVLTPFPGTPLYERLRRENRLLQERAWDRCTLFDVSFRPARMSVEQLEEGMRWLFARFYGAQESRARQRRFVERYREGLRSGRAGGTGADAGAGPLAIS